MTLTLRKLLCAALGTLSLAATVHAADKLVIVCLMPQRESAWLQMASWLVAAVVNTPSSSRASVSSRRASGEATQP